MLELPAGARVDGAVLGRDDAGGNGLRQRKRAADGLHPVAHLRGVGVAQLHGRQRRAGIDLDDRQVGGLVDADHARRTAQILGVGIGGELDVNLVGLLDHVIVGDDVALGIDDEARAQRLLHSAALVAALGRGNLAAEEAVEKVLEVVGALSLSLSLSLLLIVFVSVVIAAGSSAGWAERWKWKLRVPLFADCLGRVWVLMFTTAGPTCRAIFTKSLGGTVELTTLRGVASALSFCFSCPRTPWAAKDPATIAAESVASRTNVEARRRERSRSKSDFMEFDDLVRVTNLAAGSVDCANF